jgi:gas vesicle protein
MAENKGLWFLAGLGVGTVIGILYAPRSGAETREYLGRKTGEGRDLVTRKAGELRQQASDLVDRGREYIDKGKDAVSRQVDRGREVWGRNKEQFQAAVDAGKQAYRESTGTEPSVNQ